MSSSFWQPYKISASFLSLGNRSVMSRCVGSDPQVGQATFCGMNVVPVTLAKSSRESEGQAGIPEVGLEIFL